jgi:DNA-binding CsgD family transcriptional regulator
MARTADARIADLRVHIRQLCCLGLSSEQLTPPLLKAVRQLVDAESAGFFWVDARGEMTSLYADRLLPAPVMKLYFERFYDNGESSFRRAFIERSRATEPTSVTPSPALEHSAYYNEVFRELDAHHVLYGIVREQGEAIGQLSLYRPKAAPPFAAKQRAQLASIMRYVGHGVSHRGHAVTDATEFVDTDDEAVLLIGADGGVRELSQSGRKLLILATQGRIGPAEIAAGLEDAARPLLRKLAAQLQSIMVGGRAMPPTVAVQNSWGRFLLRAYAISDGPVDAAASIAVRIQRQEPLLLRFVDALQGLGLSPQQREIAAGLAKGLTNRELAETLGLSANTVAYHVKQLFGRLDAHDRQQMIEGVLGRAGPR